MCNENNIEVREFPLTVDKIPDIDEAFLTGTTGEITPIIKIDNTIIANGKVGKITKKLQQFYKDYLKKKFY